MGIQTRLILVPASAWSLNQFRLGLRILVRLLKAKWPPVRSRSMPSASPYSWNIPSFSTVDNRASYEVGGACYAQCALPLGRLWQTDALSRNGSPWSAYDYITTAWPKNYSEESNCHINDHHKAKATLFSLFCKGFQLSCGSQFTGSSRLHHF